MPTYDHRVFKADDEWWVAEVHLAFGSVLEGGERRMRVEQAFFTCLTDHSQKSRKVEIPAGTLLTMQYSAIQSLLSRAEVLNERIDMHPYNLPPEPEDTDKVFVDSQGTRWILRPVILPTYKLDTSQYAVDIICLDDSAVHGTIGMADETTYSSFVRKWGREAMEQLIALVHERYLKESDPKMNPRSRTSPPVSTTIEALVDSSSVTFGEKYIPISYPVFFTDVLQNFRGVKYIIMAGIINHKVYAGSKPTRCKPLEKAVVSAIENHPDHTFELKSLLKALEAIDD